MVDRNLAVAGLFGASPDVPRFWLPRREDDQAAVNQLLAESGVDARDRLVAIVPTSRQLVKNWPLERFVEVAVLLAQEKNRKIVLLGSPDDHATASMFADALGPKLVNLVGKTRIRQLSLVFDKIHLCIGNDSGPIHMAAVCRVPVIACFGATNPQAAAPYGAGHVSLVSQTTPCRPCGVYQCHNPHYLDCMKAITVEEVMAGRTTCWRARETDAAAPVTVTPRVGVQCPTGMERHDAPRRVGEGYGTQSFCGDHCV